MKGTIIKSFVDKETEKLQIVGSVIEYNDKRFKELQSGGYLKAVEETSGKKDTDKPGSGA